jgi:enoyl-CoA hydratase/carnithine racemase
MSVTYRSGGSIARLTFDRPAKKNAITAEMYEQFVSGLEQAAADRSVRVVLVSGTGGTFTAGNDLKDFSNPKFAQADSPVIRFMQGLAGFEKPVVAAVQGMAVGIGVTLLFHCDLVYAADDATFSMPFTALGLVPEFASTLLMPQVSGRVRAAEKLLLGKPFPAAEAVVLGLANAVLPAADVVGHAEKVAKILAALPPGAVRDTKRLLRQPQAAAVKDAILLEAHVFGPRLAGGEAREAIAAILEKRAPDFSKFE